ncbi:MAG: CPBP family intramembrane metalloprotease [Candidatus Nomurabacteria bacterium]|nr:MAG: CPBP family intramembrane metalloprotease [Candidatus Nomurabacteria bacterium]
MKKIFLLDVFFLLALQYIFFHGLGATYRWVNSSLVHIPIFLAWFNIQMLFLCLATLVLVMVGLALRGKSFVWLGFEALPKNTVSSIGLFIALSFPIALLGRLIVSDFDAWYANGAGLLSWAGVGAFVVTLVFSVLKEELLQRFMQRMLMEHLSNLSIAIVMASSFALAHYFTPVAYGVSSVVSVAFIAFLLAVLYLRTKNILVTFFFHFCFNLIITIQISLHARGDGVGEFLLWSLWGLAFLWTLKPAWKALRESLSFSSSDLQPKTLVFLTLFGFLLPLLYTFLLN